MSASDRVLSWLVTGPLGRLVAFVLDLATALTHALLRRGRDA